jgi:chromosome segregation ATPase
LIYDLTTQIQSLKDKDKETKQSLADTLKLVEQT